MKPSVKRLFAVFGIGFGVMILAMIWAIANTALASIQKDLGATILQLQWMMNAFGIFLCVPLLTMGKLGDSFGRKKFFLIGLFGTLIASIIAGFSDNVSMLIGCMALYGLSGSIILPLSQALIVHQYPEKQKEKAIALWAVFVSISLAIGPMLGGLIINYLGWRWVYFINIPFICFVIPLVYFFVTKEDKQSKPHCDWAGVGLLAMIVATLIVPIMQGPAWGWDSFGILSLFTICALSIVLFIKLESKSATPLFRPDLFLKRAFLCSAIANGCTIGFIWVAFFMIPLYLQNMRNFTPLEAGTTMILATLPVALLSVQVGKLYTRFGPRPLLLSGFTLFVVASLLQATLIDGPEFWPIAVATICLGFGWVLAWGPSISSALSSLPHNLAGTASGMFTTLQELGAVLSLAIAGVIFRMTRQSSLEPHMGQINQALHNFTPDRADAFLSDPSSLQTIVEPTSPIVPWVREAFLSAYHNAFWFVLALSLLALLMTLLLPTKKKPVS